MALEQENLGDNAVETVSPNGVDSPAPKLGSQPDGVAENIVGSLDSSDDEEQAGNKFSEVMEGDHNFPPKVTSEKEVLADGITKQIIKSGRGDETPTRHATCFVQYRAWTERTMFKFDDTWQEGASLEIVLGQEKKVMRGMAIGIASMKLGEHSLFHVGWEYAYGEEGNFSFPNVPPKADVIYEVELIGFENAKEGRPRGEMTVEERIDAANRRRLDGNEFFKEGNLQEAIQQYEIALAYMGDDFMFQLFGKYKDMADAVKTPCHLNMAASLLRLEKYDEAIGHCNIVLAEDKNNTKALFRRGKARSSLGQTESAKEDFEKVKALAPEDKAVIRELRIIAQADRELHIKQKELYKGLFSKPPPPAPKKDPWYLIAFQWIVSLFSYFFRLVGVNRLKND